MRQTLASSIRQVILCSSLWVETYGVVGPVLCLPSLRRIWMYWSKTSAGLQLALKDCGVCHRKPGEEKFWEDYNHVWVSDGGGESSAFPSIPMEMTTTHWKNRKSNLSTRKQHSFFLWGWSDTGTSGGFHLYRYLEPSCELSPGKSVLSDPALGIRVGLQDIKCSFPNSVILWFCEVQRANPFDGWCYTHLCATSEDCLVTRIIFTSCCLLLTFFQQQKKIKRLLWKKPILSKSWDHHS